MTDQPLQAFALPAGFGTAGIDLSSGLAIEIMLGIVFGFWLIYTLVAIYHWMKYSHSSLIAFPVIFLHLVVSVALMSYGLTGNIIPTL